MATTYNLQRTPLAKIHTSSKKQSSGDYNNFIKNYKKTPNNNANIKNIVKKLSRSKFKIDSIKKKHITRPRNVKSNHVKSHNFNKMKKSRSRSRRNTPSSKPIVVKKLQSVDINNIGPNKDGIAQRGDAIKPQLNKPTLVSVKPTNKYKQKRSYNKKQLMNIKKKINSIKKHTLSRRKKYTKKSKNRHIIVNLKSPTTNKKNNMVKKLIDKLSSKDLRKLLINKNVINKNSHTPDKLLKDIYMYSELCNVNITK